MLLPSIKSSFGPPLGIRHLCRFIRSPNCIRVSTSVRIKDLDIIRDLREATDKPIAAYQVSGEYSQIHAAARLGWLDLGLCRRESLLAIRRAGADMILTYFAKSVAGELAR